MQSVAPAGGIVISGDARRLVEGYFELRELGNTDIPVERAAQKRALALA